MRVRQEDNDELEVQMGPLIDCVFLLLIFFIVIAVTKKSINVLALSAPPPAAHIGGEVAENTVVIRLERTRNDEALVNVGGKKVPLSDATWTDAVNDSIMQAREQATDRVPARVRLDLHRKTQVQDLMKIWNFHLKKHKDVPWRMHTTMEE